MLGMGGEGHYCQITGLLLGPSGAWNQSSPGLSNHPTPLYRPAERCWPWIPGWSPWQARPSSSSHTVSSLAAAAGEAQGGNSGRGGRGVGLGLHPAHCDPGQHDEWRPGCPLREAEHRGPDHVHQWHQLGGAASRHLPGCHQGGCLGPSVMFAPAPCHMTHVDTEARRESNLEPKTTKPEVSDSPGRVMGQVSSLLAQRCPQPLQAKG